MPRSLPGRRLRGANRRTARVAVVGDLMLDVVLAPSRPLALGTDVPGRVSLRQGGSAASTARWMARLGVRTTLICAVGRDAEGRALLAAVRSEGLRVRAVRVAGERTGRIGVIVAPGGERSFVADRAAADRLLPEGLRPADLEVDLLHLPAYSLLGEPLGAAGRRSIALARASHALVSLDLASVGPLLAAGRQAATSLVEDAAPDILFATTAEAEALAGGHDLEVLSKFARLVAIKRGRGGATVFAPASGSPSRRLAFDVATSSVEAPDTTGAGDAFDAGFLAVYLASAEGERERPAALRRAVLAGHRTAARQLAAGPRELAIG